jgi:hypothetical protein
MTLDQIVQDIFIGLAVNECCDVSPWAARKVVRWSAHRRYPPSRAAVRAEELAAYVDDCPGNVLKLITALCFATVAIVTALFEGLAPRVSAAIGGLAARWPRHLNSRFWIIILILELVFVGFPLTAGLLKLPASTASTILAVIFGCVGVTILVLLVWGLVWDWQGRQRPRDRAGEPSYADVVNNPGEQSYAGVVNDLSGGPWRSSHVARERERNNLGEAGSHERLNDL